MSNFLPTEPRLRVRFTEPQPLDKSFDWSKALYFGMPGFEEARYELVVIPTPPRELKVDPEAIHEEMRRSMQNRTFQVKSGIPVGVLDPAKWDIKPV